MSAREKFLLNIDSMSETFLDKVYTLWIDEEALSKKHECPICKSHNYEFNDETMKSLENCVNDVNCETFATLDDLKKFVEQLADEDD
jgi:hypothetical protein